MLFFEPVYQTGTYAGEPVPNQGAPVLNTWQTWNARVGGWWTLSSGTFGPPLTTLEKYGASNPTATILNLRVATGCGGAAWANFQGNVDNVTFGANGSTTYDFEPQQTVPTSKAQCKKGGWKNLVDSRGRPFKNQGQCVAFVNRGVKGKGNERGRRP
jgi:hypothetical protein